MKKWINGKLFVLREFSASLTSQSWLQARRRGSVCSSIAFAKESCLLFFDEKSRPVVFDTFEGAEAEIRDFLESRLAHASSDLEKHIYEEDTEEFVLKVKVFEDGTVLPVVE